MSKIYEHFRATRIERKALERLGASRIILAAVPGGIKELAAAAGVSPSRVSQVLREQELPSAWAERIAKLIGCGAAEVYQQLERKPPATRFEAPPRIVWIGQETEEGEMLGIKEHPIDRANRRRLEQDEVWKRESSRKAADELLARTEEEARRLVGCEASLTHVQGPVDSSDKLELRYGDAFVYVDCHQTPEPSASPWPFAVTAIWREDRGPTDQPARTESVYLRVVPASGQGDRWRWRIVGSGQNEGLEEDLDGMIVLIFDLLTRDLDERRSA